MTSDRTKLPATTVALSQAALGFVAGYVDTVAFVGLNGLFVTMVTGNVIVAGANLLAFSGDRVLPNILSIPIYFVAVTGLVAGRRLPRVSGFSVRTRVRSLLAIQALLLAVFAGFAVHLSRLHGFPLVDVNDIAAVGAIGVAAMSIQNAFSRLTDSANPPTTIMTGNLTQVATSLAWLAASLRDRQSAVWNTNVKALRSMLPALLGFFAGAVIAAPTIRSLGFHSLWPIVVFLIAVTPIVERGESLTN